MKKWSTFIFALLATLGLVISVAVAADGPDREKLIEGAKQEGEVMIWSHTWEKGVAEPFEKMYPFLKVKVWDGRNETVVNKMITEAKAGRHAVDVLILVNRGLIALKDAGFLRHVDWPERVKKWPNQADHGYWAYFGSNPYVSIYNPKFVPPDQAPKSWDDLKNPRWKGKAGISISGGEVPLLNAYLWRKSNGDLNWDKAIGFWKEVVKNTSPNRGSGFHRPTELTVSGEQYILLHEALSVALRYLNDGATLKIVPVGKLVGSGWGVALPKTVPHPNAAKLFIDYLLSDQGIVNYANSHYTIVMDPQLAKTAKPNKMIREIGLDVDVIPDSYLTSGNLKKASSAWLNALGVKRRRRR